MHVKNFAQTKLTKLTRKDCNWNGGELPMDAMKAL